jgi:hypothetical protein
MSREPVMLSPTLLRWGRALRTHGQVLRLRYGSRLRLREPGSLPATQPSRANSALGYTDSDPPHAFYFAELYNDPPQLSYKPRLLHAYHSYFCAGHKLKLYTPRLVFLTNNPAPNCYDTYTTKLCMGGTVVSACPKWLVSIDRVPACPPTSCRCNDNDQGCQINPQFCFFLIRIEEGRQ